ncbi:MAG: hypothetical protein ABIY55_09710 [Kofleriaceae bacterium]
MIQEAPPSAQLAQDTPITARPIADYRTGRVRARILEDEEFWQNQTEL